MMRRMWGAPARSCKDPSSFGGRWRAVSPDLGRLWQEYGGTALTQVVVLVAHLLSVRLGVIQFGAAGYGEFSIAKRTASLISFPLLLGMGISLPRFIARVQATPDIGPRVRAYAMASALVAVCILPGATVLLILLSSAWLPMVFGDGEFGYYAWPIVVMSLGLYAQTLVYALYRGLLEMTTANRFLLITSGIVPLVALLVARSDPARCTILTGYGWLCLAGVYIALGFIRLGSNHTVRDWPDWALIRGSARELVVYGLPRVPGEVGWFGFLAVPVVVVGRQAGMATAGLFSAALSVVQLISSLFTFLSVILLPKVAGLLSLGRVAIARRLVSRTVAAVAVAASGLALVLIAAARIWVPYLLDSTTAEAIAIGRVCCAAGIPLSLHIVLRSPVDAASAFPHNAVNLLISLGIILAVLFAVPTANPAISVAVGSGVLAVLSWRAWRHLLVS
ncbi:MAG: hypothetical protein R6X16_09500 [Anaerolineae bacterium]